MHVRVYGLRCVPVVPMLPSLPPLQVHTLQVAQVTPTHLLSIQTSRFAHDLLQKPFPGRRLPAPLHHQAGFICTNLLTSRSPW